PLDPPATGPGRRNGARSARGARRSMGADAPSVVTAEAHQEHGAASAFRLLLVEAKLCVRAREEAKTERLALRQKLEPDLEWESKRCGLRVDGVPGPGPQHEPRRAMAEVPRVEDVEAEKRTSQDP